MAAKLASEYNVVTALIHYRLSERGKQSQIKYPDHVIDALNGFINVTLSLRKYKVNTNKIFIGGHSAGAHLASLISLQPSKYISEDNINKNQCLELINKIQGVVALGGIFDLPLLGKQNTTYIDEFIKSAFGEDTIKGNQMSTWMQASPQYVSQEALEQTGYDKLPRYLLVDSSQDALVSHQQTKGFYQHLKQLGFNNVDIVEEDFGEHNYMPTNKKVQEAIVNFIHRI